MYLVGDLLELYDDARTYKPKNGTLIAKHGGDASLISIHIEQCAFDWCNKLTGRNEQLYV